jgi:hypothetical protein
MFQAVDGGDPPAWTLSFIADVSSLVGLAITIVGFIVTVYNVRKSKAAAERAEEAARNARSNLLRVDSIAGISGVITGLEDIQRFNRLGSWHGTPERYALQRRTLVSIRSGNMALTDAQRSTLQSVIQQLLLLETQIEGHLAAPAAQSLDVPKVNGVISKHVDNLTQLLSELRVAGERS